MARMGKRLKAVHETIDRDAQYAAEEAVKLVKDGAKAKFDETIEIAMNLGVDPRHADQMVRGVVQLPNGTGKNVKVAVFAKDAKAEEAKEAGADFIFIEAPQSRADFVGAEELAEQIQGGMMDFDRCIATPDMMAVVGRLGKVLGPRGLMPNPKLGTVTPDVVQAIKDAKGGQVEYRVEKAGVIHAGIGKASFSEDAILENFKAFFSAVAGSKPTGAKGTFIKKVALSSTMGAGVVIDVASLSGQ